MPTNSDTYFHCKAYLNAVKTETSSNFILESFHIRFDQESLPQIYGRAIFPENSRPKFRCRGETIFFSQLGFNCNK